jgi:hypothetical protein
MWVPVPKLPVSRLIRSYPVRRPQHPRCVLNWSASLPPSPYYRQMANNDRRNHLSEVTLASVAQEMAQARMTASVREALRKSSAANCLFDPNECVYNRATKEHGLVKQVYEKEGVTMYKVWLPGTPGLLGWGHSVSDWAESVLEPSDKIPKSARL